MAGGARTVEAGGESLRAALDDLTEQHPALRSRLLDDDGEINAFVNVYVEGEDVRTLDGLETPVAFGSTVILLPAMAGGGA
jgi:molybdopterin synthase sulfur carrier subunit